MDVSGYILVSFQVNPSEKTDIGLKTRNFEIKVSLDVNYIIDECIKQINPKYTSIRCAYNEMYVYIMCAHEK